MEALSGRVGVKCGRWNPTAEQVKVLTELFRAGLRTPSTDQIQRISNHLSAFGKVESKNVFYWFQNHKARERHHHKKRRRVSSCSPESSSNEEDSGGLRAAVRDAEPADLLLQPPERKREARSYNYHQRIMACKHPSKSSLFILLHSVIRRVPWIIQVLIPFRACRLCEGCGGGGGDVGEADEGGGDARAVPAQGL
jgi:hypothetical protein